MLSHSWRQLFGRHVAVHAVFHQTDTADRKIYLICLHSSTAVACSADNASPVRVLTEEGCFYQRRFGNRHRCGFGILPGCGTGNIYLEEFSSALAVMRNHFCKVGSTGNQRFKEGRIIRMLLRKNDFVFGKTVGKHNHAVVGTGIAVDNNHVEGFVGSLFHRALQHIGSNGGVGSDEGQHSCHVRMNHARTLGNTGKGYLLAADFRFIGSVLDKGIRSLNRHSAAFALTFVQAVDSIGNAGQQLVHRQKLADNTGGADKDCFRSNA